MTDGPNRFTRDEGMAFIRGRAMAQAEDYARRGRAYQSLELEALREIWRNVFREMAAHPDVSNHQQQHTDLDAEFLLRTLEPPYEEPEMLALSNLFVEAADTLIRSLPPERFEEVNAELTADMNEGLGRTKPKH